MAQVAVPNVFTAGAVIVASEHNSNFSTIYNEFNGNIDNSNIKSSAAIVDTKLATISTAGKVNISALTVSSQATGDLIVASGATTWTRLATGTSFQVLVGGTSPSYGGVPSGALPGGTVIQVTNNIGDSTFGPSENGAFGSVQTGTTTIPNDDTIPQNTEGDQYMKKSITPNSATNKLLIEVTLIASVDTNNDAFAVALFQDSTANALICVPSTGLPSAGDMNTVTFTYFMTSGTTSSTTFKVRAGYITGSGTLTFNGSAGGRKFGGVAGSMMTITEIKV